MRTPTSGTCYYMKCGLGSCFQRRRRIRQCYTWPCRMSSSSMPTCAGYFYLIQLTFTLPYLNFTICLHVLPLTYLVLTFILPLPCIRLPYLHLCFCCLTFTWTPGAYLWITIVPYIYLHLSFTLPLYLTFTFILPILY